MRRYLLCWGVHSELHISREAGFHLHLQKKKKQKGKDTFLCVGCNYLIPVCFSESSLVDIMALTQLI